MSKAIFPISSGIDIFISDILKLDLGKAAHGYIKAAVLKESIRKKKLRVTKDETTLNYDMKLFDTYEVIPLQFGSGIYTVGLWENTTGKKYTNLGEITFNVSMKQENEVFLYPNQYVNYDQDSPVIQIANELCKDKSKKEAYDIIKAYITKNYRYNYIKAGVINPGALPDIQTCYEKKTGICQDLSALMVCMLRSQLIPAKLIIGYADRMYHAWVEVSIDGKRIRYDPTAVIMKTRLASKYKIERFY